jgi:hypothetical protein
MTRSEDLEQQLDRALMDRPETGEAWAHICWLEAELIKERAAEAYDNGQFGVGA